MKFKVIMLNTLNGEPIKHWLSVDMDKSLIVKMFNDIQSEPGPSRNLQFRAMEYYPKREYNVLIPGAIMDRCIIEIIGD